MSGSTKSSYSIVPCFILDDNDLDEGAKILYARISMLSQEGRCWATNGYFAEKQKVTERCVQKWLQQLKEKEYIDVEIDSNGYQTTRTIWLSNDFKKMFKGRTTVQGGVPYSSGGSEPQFTPLNKDDNSYVTKESYVPTQESLGLASLFLENILQEQPGFKRPSHLNGWAKDIDSMMRLDHRNLEELKEVILWCTHDPFWKSNVMSGAKLRQQFDQLKAKMPASKASVPASKKIVLEELQKRYPKAIQQGFLVVGYDYVEFIAGVRCEQIKIEEGGFVEQIENNLRKMNVDTAWLQEFRG